jgi:serine/threonine protein kinase/Tfp pilus assembly protein PilF
MSLRGLASNERFNPMPVISAGRICENCGSSLDLDILSGFCPGCLLNTVLQTESDLASGNRIEDYELLNEVARGGMGIVYRARQRVPSRVVALKMILPTHLNSPGAVNRFRAEAEAAASLDHESILPIYAVGEHDGAPFYSMKFAEGGTLSAKIDNYRSKPREAAALIAKLARAVAFAHENGILHRDLKPGNILFDSAGKSFVSDFGLAKWLERECDLTQTLAILGTPYYMAPEQAKDSRAVTAAADVYSLGAILYYMLTGRPPIAGETPMEVLHRAAAEKPKSPRLTNSRIPRDLETICLKCLEKEPTARYKSAAALAKDIERFCAGHTIQARPVGLTNRAWRWTRRNPVLAGLSAVTAALLTLLVTTLLLNFHRRAAVPVLPEKSIAVLPFASFGDDKENAYLADGVQENILTDLTKIADLKVISRRSVEQYRDRKQNIRQIGQALNVSYVLEGTVRKAADKIHVTTQLIDTRNETETWAEKYEREFADIYLIQSDIAQEVVSRLKAELSPREKEAIEEKPTQDMEAYDLYLRARSLVYGQDWKMAKDAEDSANKATELLESAIARDPKFTLAYCALADAQLEIDDLSGIRDQRWQNKAKQAIDAALRISPDSAEAHIVSARYFIQNKEDAADGERDLAIAAAGLPGRVAVFNLRAVVEEQRGQWKEALRDRERALELDPRDPEPGFSLARLYILLRRYAQAERLSDHMIAIQPKESLGQFWRLKSRIALARGDTKAATAAFDSNPSLNAGLYGLTGLLADLFIMQRNYPKAAEILQTMVEPGKTRFVTPKAGAAGYQLFWRAMALERLGRIARFRGETDKARSSFEAARTCFEQWLPWDTGHNLWLGGSHVPALIAEIDAALGRKDKAILEGLKAVETWPLHRDARISPAMKVYLAIIYLWSGDRDAALQQLSEASKLPVWPSIGPMFPGLTAGELKLDPVWDELRGDPRFEKVIAEAAKPIEIK